MNFFDYFIRFYLHKAFGATYIITEAVCCFAVSFIFNQVNCKKWEDYLRLLIDYAVTFSVFRFLSCLIYFICESVGALSWTKYTRFVIWPRVCLLHTIYPRNKRKYINRFTCGIFSSVFIARSVNLSGALGSYITDTTGHFPDSIWGDWTLYIVLTGLLLIVFFFKFLSPFKFKYVKAAPVILINVIFLLSFALTILASVYIKDSSIFPWCLYLFLRAISFLSYVIFYFLTRNYNSVIDYQAKARKAEFEKNQVEISKGQYEELHRIRHDLKNQRLLLEDRVERKDYSARKDYFADLDEKVHVTIDTVNTPNPSVNSVLNRELSKAKGLGIGLDTHLSLPSELPMDYQDRTSLRSNLIDNALEADVRYNLKDPIEVQRIYDKNYLFVKVINVLPQGEDEKKLLRLHSNKKSRNRHGYGTKIIKSICQKYNGTARFDIEDGKFVFDGRLYLPLGKEAKANGTENAAACCR